MENIYDLSGERKSRDSRSKNVEEKCVFYELLYYMTKSFISRQLRYLLRYCSIILYERTT